VNGVILGYRAVVDPRAVGKGLRVFVRVKVRYHAGNYVRRSVAEIMALPEVVVCHHVTGGFDYLLRTEVADLTAFAEFHAGRLADVPGLDHVTSFVAMDMISSARRSCSYTTHWSPSSAPTSVAARC
jgi:Lrp/AsnC family leucine-responsive transcriptional regulator